MVSKTLKIVLDAVLSVVVFIVTAILLAWAGGAIFGTVKGPDGKDYGNYSGLMLIVITFVITVVFSVLFYKFLNRKSKATKEQI